MRTEPPFNIETLPNPYEIKPVEKIHLVDNDQLKEDEAEWKKRKNQKRSVLPPDPFGEKGNKIDILG